MPSEVFSISHKDLVEEAAKWTTDLLTTTFIVVATILWGALSVNTTRLPPDPSDYFVVASKIGSFLSFVSFLVFIALKVPLRNNEEFLKTIMKKLYLDLFTLLLSIVLFVTALFSPTLERNGEHSGHIPDVGIYIFDMFYSSLLVIKLVHFLRVGTPFCRILPLLHKRMQCKFFVQLH